MCDIKSLLDSKRQEDMERFNNAKATGSTLYPDLESELETMKARLDALVAEEKKRSPSPPSPVMAEEVFSFGDIATTTSVNKSKKNHIHILLFCSKLRVVFFCSCFYCVSDKPLVPLFKPVGNKHSKVVMAKAISPTSQVLNEITDCLKDPKNINNMSKKSMETLLKMNTNELGKKKNGGESMADAAPIGTTGLKSEDKKKRFATTANNAKNQGHVAMALKAKLQKKLEQKAKAKEMEKEKEASPKAEEVKIPKKTKLLGKTHKFKCSSVNDNTPRALGDSRKLAAMGFRPLYFHAIQKRLLLPDFLTFVITVLFFNAKQNVYGMSRVKRDAHLEFSKKLVEFYQNPWITMRKGFFEIRMVMSGSPNNACDHTVEVSEEEEDIMSCLVTLVNFCLYVCTCVFFYITRYLGTNTCRVVT